MHSEPLLPHLEDTVRGAVNSQVTPQTLEDEHLNIVQRTAIHYAKLAMHLMDDVNLVITASLEMQFRHNPEIIAKEVYKKWISGTGRKPISWQTLVCVLRDIQLNSLAEEIEAALKHLG
ncbi:hypothetical protein EMCRGX_G027220 [Ephydatia muelleri]